MSGLIERKMSIRLANWLIRKIAHGRGIMLNITLTIDSANGIDLTGQKETLFADCSFIGNGHSILTFHEIDSSEWDLWMRANEK